MPESLTPLQKRNIEASLEELRKDEAILGKYRDREFFAIGEAMDWLSEQIISLEEELEGVEEDED
jgi:hypothetical protein